MKHTSDVFLGGERRLEECCGSYRPLPLFAARLGDSPAEGLSTGVFGGTHKPSTSQPDWSAMQPGFAVEAPAQRGPAHQGSGHFTQCWSWQHGSDLFNPKLKT